MSPTTLDASSQFDLDVLENTSESRNYLEIVETVISTLDTNNTAMFSERGGAYLWKFQNGSVEVFVQMTGMQEEDTFTVWSHVMKLPAKNEVGLMRKVLEMNWLTTIEAHFAIVADQLVVVSSRAVADLDPAEISRVITIVATIADENDENLIAEFNT